MARSYPLIRCLEGCRAGDFHGVQSTRYYRELVMPTPRINDAVRRSSDDAGGSPDVRRAVVNSLNERRLQRERIIASLLLCPGPGPEATPPSRSA
jgi:hypothetical protein